MTLTRKTTFQFYALAVCFSSLSVFVVSLGGALYSAVGVVSPGFTVARWSFTFYDSNEEYLEFWKGMHSGAPIPSGTELTAMRKRDSERELILESAKRRQGLLQFGIALVLSGGVFLLHWRMAKRETAEGQVA